MLKLGGENFGTIFCATGARGFYGEGYPFHKVWKHAGMCWKGTGFSGKTMTLLPRRGPEFGEPGNMSLKEDGVTPQELFPKSIWTDFSNGGEMMNAVGLSNFGIEFYFQTGNFHKITNPFFISIMLMATDASGQEAELRAICGIINRFKPFRAPIALQINYGCPNSGHDLTEYYARMCYQVELAKDLLGIPVVVNCNALMPTSVLVEASHIADGLWIGNTIPFRAKETEGRIDWSRYGERSPVRNKLDPIDWQLDLENKKMVPVEKRKNDAIDGGLSSPVCLPLTIEKVLSLRDSGVSVPIVGGNGVRTMDDISNLRRAGCNAAFAGSLAVVRPYQMKKITPFAQYIFG